MTASVVGDYGGGGKRRFGHDPESDPPVRFDREVHSVGRVESDIPRIQISRNTVEQVVGEVRHRAILPGRSGTGRSGSKSVNGGTYDASVSQLELPELADAVWRPLTADDADAMSALQQTCFAVDGGHRIVAAEMREEFDRFGEDAPVCSVGAFTPEGRLLAFGWAQVPQSGVTEHRGFVWMEIDPEYRGAIEDALLDWVEDAGCQRLRLFTDGVPTALYRYEVYDWMTDRIALMERHGYGAVRYFTENVRDLSLPIDDRPLAEGLVARAWSAQAEVDALVVHNAAFADHWGSQPIEEDAWKSYNSGEFFQRHTSWVVYDGTTPVAYIKSGKYPHDFEDRGRTESWIEAVGTVRSHRGRGIASTLIAMALKGYRDDGMEYACLGVDSENPTGANRIYERLGFVPEKRMMAFRKAIESGS